MTDGTTPPFPGSRMERRRAEEAAKATAAEEAQELDGHSPEAAEAPDESAVSEPEGESTPEPAQPEGEESVELENSADSQEPEPELEDTDAPESEPADEASLPDSDHPGFPGSRMAARKKTSKWAWIAIGLGVALIIAAIVLAIYAFGGASSYNSQSGNQQSRSTVTVPVSGKELSTLREECAAGDMMACDQLYFEAPVGSEDEAFGNTCGERQLPGKYCHLSALETEQSLSPQSANGEESTPQS